MLLDKIPAGWHEVSLGQYLEIIEIAKSNLIDDLTKNVNILSILTDTPEARIEEMPATDFVRAVKQIAWVNEQPKPVERMPEIVDFDGVSYLVNLQIGKMEAWQWLDVMNFNQGDASENMHKIIARFCWPAKKQKTVLGHRFVKDTACELEDVEQHIRERMPVPIALGLFAFFLKTLQLTLNSILMTLSNQMSRVTWRAKLRRAMGVKQAQAELAGLWQLTELRSRLDEIGREFTKYQ